MNHQKVYESIIENAKDLNRIKLKKNQENYVYYENHHILPRCLDGNNDKDNLVLLTAREHFVCHKLLTYIYKGNRKIALAFHKITYSKNGNYIKSSRDYQYAREVISNTSISKETRLKLSKAGVGRISAMKGRHHSQKSKDIISQKLKGRIVSKETKQKQKDANLGEKNPMHGKPGHFLGTHLQDNQKQHLRNLYFGKTLEELYGMERAKEIKEKISQKVSTKLKGHIVSEETRKKISERAKERYKDPMQREKTSKTTKDAIEKIKELKKEDSQASQKPPNQL